jgi:chitinase
VGCFAQYKEMTEQYPHVKVAIAVGGWGAKWFSEMALTEQSRKSFVDSCVETMLEYPFISGIDIDWEYPGTARNGDGAGFQGRKEDKENFTALMKEMREAFDEAGLQDKILTYCVISNVGSLRSGSVAIDLAAVDKYVDRVNIMSYDLSGNWSSRALRQTALNPGKNVEKGSSAAEVAEYIISLGVLPSKINIGTPLYTRGFVVDAENGDTAIGKPTASSYASPAYGTIGSG